MQKQKRMAQGIFVAAILFGILTVGTVRADIFGSILKGGGIAFLIKQFSPQINTALNKITGSAGAPMTEATKVVPIVSVGQGGYVGAAQVSGPQAALNSVQAVGMIEGSLVGKQFRLKALVPIDTDKPNSSRGLHRIKGVGVSAIIDIQI